MEWSPDPDALRGRVAVVAGATRGAGRGIAAAFGEVGATVVCTGRSTGSVRFEYDRYVGRAIVAMATDPDRTRWNQLSVDSGRLAREYGFTDVDGSQPDSWRYIEEVAEPGVNADLADYR